tara:strand:- start:671 stop:1234 length:564 start_codon:yes stop_codon:yes gene_type:complete
MNNQNLFIYDSDTLYKILKELNDFLSFEIINIPKNQLKNTNFIDFNNYLILSNEKKNNLKNQIIFNDFPIKVSKLIERINVEFLKQKFNIQSNIDVGLYRIDINSRLMTSKIAQLKLTEKEINTIVYLSNKIDSTSVDELQKEVWGYNTELETHTVETHIHRLRKKIKEKFNEENFIISTKNGYKIK